MVAISVILFLLSASFSFIGIVFFVANWVGRGSLDEEVRKDLLAWLNYRSNQSYRSMMLELSKIRIDQNSVNLAFSFSARLIYVTILIGLLGQVVFGVLPWQSMLCIAAFMPIAFLFNFVNTIVFIYSLARLSKTYVFSFVYWVLFLMLALQSINILSSMYYAAQQPSHEIIGTLLEALQFNLSNLSHPIELIQSALTHWFYLVALLPTLIVPIGAVLSLILLRITKSSTVRVVLINFLLDNIRNKEAKILSRLSSFCFVGAASILGFAATL